MLQVPFTNVLFQCKRNIWRRTYRLMTTFTPASQIFYKHKYQVHYFKGIWDLTIININLALSKNCESNYETSGRWMKCYLLSSTFSVTANAWVALLSFWIITSIESWTATSNGPVGLDVETLLTAEESPLPVLFEVDKDGSRCINSAKIALKH